MPLWKTELELPWGEQLETDLLNALISSCPYLSCSCCLLSSETRPKSQHSFKASCNQASETRKVNDTAKAHIYNCMGILIQINIKSSLESKEKGSLFHKKKKQLAASWKRRKVSYLEPILLWLYVEEHKGAPNPAVAAFHALIPISRRALPEHLLRAKTGLSGTRGSIFCLVDYLSHSF